MYRQNFSNSDFSFSLLRVATCGKQIKSVQAIDSQIDKDQLLYKYVLVILNILLKLTIFLSQALGITGMEHSRLSYTYVFCWYIAHVYGYTHTHAHARIAISIRFNTGKNTLTDDIYARRPSKARVPVLQLTNIFHFLHSQNLPKPVGYCSAFLYSVGCGF